MMQMESAQVRLTESRSRGGIFLRIFPVSVQSVEVQ